MSPVASCEHLLENVILATLLHSVEAWLWSVEENSTNRSWDDVASRWRAGNRAERTGS
jgi:hypothetical protein